MKTISQFVKRRPWWACAITAVIGFYLALDWVAWCTIGAWPDIPVYLVIIGITLVAMWLDKRLIAISVALAMATAAPAQEKLPLVIIAGVVIIGGGAFIGCRAVKRCNKIAQRTNQWPEELFVPAGADYGALFTWVTSEPCVDYRQSEPQAPVTFTLTINVMSKTNVTCVGSAQTGQQYSTDWAGFMEEMAGLDLNQTSDGLPTACYEQNRLRCAAEDVPVSMDWTTHTVRLGSGGVQMWIERSEDLITWDCPMALDVEPGKSLRFEDAGVAGHSFYRLKVEE